MRLLVAVDGEKHWCIGNTVKAFKELVEAAEGKSSVKLLTVFYDSTKEKRRFKRELRKAGGNLIQAAKNYLNWWNTIQERRKNK
jgi:hypothetical protein